MNKHINNLDCVHLEPCRVRPWAYHRAGTRVACSKLGESGSIGRVDCAIANPKPAMLLASSRPHNHFSIKVMGTRIVLWAMDRPCHRCVSIEATVDGLIAVRRGWVIRVVGDVGRRLFLVGQSICLELGARLATMCIRRFIGGRKRSYHRHISKQLKSHWQDLFLTRS